MTVHNRFQLFNETCRHISDGTFYFSNLSSTVLPLLYAIASLIAIQSASPSRKPHRTLLQLTILLLVPSATSLYRISLTFIDSYLFHYSFSTNLYVPHIFITIYPFTVIFGVSNQHSVELLFYRTAAISVSSSPISDRSLLYDPNSSNLPSFILTLLHLPQLL